MADDWLDADENGTAVLLPLVSVDVGSLMGSVVMRLAFQRTDDTPPERLQFLIPESVAQALAESLLATISKRPN